MTCENPRIAAEFTFLCGTCPPCKEKKAETCGTCDHFYKVYGDLAFGGCHKMRMGSRNPDDKCPIDSWRRKP